MTTEQQESYVKEMQELINEMTILAEKYTDKDDEGLMKILVAAAMMFGWKIKFSTNEANDEVSAVIMGEEGLLRDIFEGAKNEEA